MTSVSSPAVTGIVVRADDNPAVALLASAPKQAQIHGKAIAMPKTTSFRRHIGAISIIGLLTTVLVTGWFDPTDSDMSKAEQLRAAAAHPGAMRATAAMLLLAATLAPVAVLTIVHVVRRRGAVLAHIGAPLGLIGAAGMAVLATHGLFLLALSNQSDPAAEAILHHLDEVAMPIVFPFILALPLALLLLATALVRARYAPTWVLPLAVAFWMIDFLPSFTGSETVQQLLGLAAFSPVAYRILHTSDLEWDTGTDTAPTPLTPGGDPAPITG